MSPRRAAVAIVGMLVALGSSCTVTSYADCDYVIRRCSTVCDYWCDGWGCYPVCYDRCWDECGIYPSPPPAPIADAAPPPPTGSDGGGVLCTPCKSNDQCGQGSLCIVRGGQTTGQNDAGDAGGGDPSATSGFCGSPCQSSADCPQGFACTQIGASRQCLPSTAACQ